MDSAHTHREKRKYTRKDQIFESPTDLDSMAFKIYSSAVEKIVHMWDGPVCTREIHDALGENAKPEWTADALCSIQTIEEVSLLPVSRYAPRPGTTPSIKIPKSQQLRWLFRKRK